MVTRPCSAKGSSWPADYRSDAVELYRKFKAGTITIKEVELQLQNKYPNLDVPHKRTLRCWANVRYCDLPERRHEFFKPQAIDEYSAQQQVLATPWVHQLLRPSRTRSFMTCQIEGLCSLMMNFVVALSLTRAAAYMSNYVGESPNEMLKSPA